MRERERERKRKREIERERVSNRGRKKQRVRIRGSKGTERAREKRSGLLTGSRTGGRPEKFRGQTEGWPTKKGIRKLVFVLLWREDFSSL